MSLPNGDDDDENGRLPWKDPYGPGQGADISPVKKLAIAETSAENDDDRTADETSIGSMSYTSDLTSVAATGTNLLPSTPLQQGHTRPGVNETPISALTATTETDDNSIQSGVSYNSEDAAGLQLRRGRNRRRLQGLGAATGATFALFMYMLVPTALLFSMILFGGVSSAFFYQLALILRFEFNRSILEGRGIGDYLPQGLYEILTSSSMHEILTDPDGIFGASEHLQYLMLYMIPGLTPEQLDRYVSRLSPRHQQLLRSQRGVLGFALNRNNHRDPNAGNPNQDSTLMRVLMGDERLREWRQQQGAQQQSSSTSSSSHPSNMAPRRLELPPTIPEEDPPTPRSRNTSGDERTSSREDAGPPIPEPPSSGIPATVATIVGRSAAPNPPPSDTQPPAIPAPQSPDRRSSVDLDLVLFDAVGSAVANFVGDTTNLVRERATESFRDALATPIYRLSLGLTALGLGVGAYGIANGTYDLQSLAQPISQLVSNVLQSLIGTGSSSSGGSGGGSAPRPSMPSTSLLVGSTIASGTTAVVLGLFGMTGSGGESDTPPPTTAAKAKTTNGGHKGDSSSRTS